jgi:hypothetical protein
VGLQPTFYLRQKPGIFRGKSAFIQAFALFFALEQAGVAGMTEKMRCPAGSQGDGVPCEWFFLAGV